MGSSSPTVERGQPALATPRLLLRPVQPDDAGALLRLRGGGRNAPLFGDDPLTDLAEAQRLIDLWTQWRRQRLPPMHWVICPTGSARVIGTCSLDLPMPVARSAQLHYLLEPAVRGRGLAREAAATVLEWGLGDFGLHRVEARIHPDNAASAAVVRALGFRLEGVLRQAGWWGGRHHDLACWSRLRGDA